MRARAKFQRSRNTFIGRESELEELRAGLDDAVGGHGRLFLISGEPGIGKSRLAHELAGHAASRAIVVLQAESSEGGGTPTYWPFIQLIRDALDSSDRDLLFKRLGAEHAPQVMQDVAQLVPELRHLDPALIPPFGQTPPDLERARFRLSESVAMLIKVVAEIRTLMLVIEDLHDSDQPSLLMLRFVVRRLKRTPVLVVGTYRDVELERSPALARLIGDLAREGTLIPLVGLDPQDTAQMIEHRTGAPPTYRLISDVHLATGGNPLFIDGLVRILAAEGKLSGGARLDLAGFRVPHGVRETIRDWLDLLADRSRLAAAAMIGQEFDLRFLQRVTQASTSQIIDEMREAAHVGIVSPLPNGAYRFLHVLIRNALTDELSSADRAEIHLKIAQAFEDIHRSNVKAHVAELAHHFREAGKADKAIDYSIRAGDAARAVFAYEEAVAHWRAALELMPKGRAQRQHRADLSERLGELLGLSAFERGEHVHYLEQALKLYEDLGQTEAVGRIHSRLASWQIIRTNSDISATLKHNRKAQDLASEGPDGFPSVLNNLGLAVTAIFQMRHDEALAASLRAMDLSERLGDEIHWSRAASQYASTLCFKGLLAEAFTLLNQVSNKADQLDDILTALMATYTGCSHLISLFDPVEAAAWTNRELAKPRMSKASFLQKSLFEYLGVSHVLMGKLKEAGTLLAQAKGGPPFEGKLLEGLLAFHVGEWQRAEEIFRRALNQELKAQRPNFFRIYSQLAARVLHIQGEQLEAESILEEVLALCMRGRPVLIEMAVRQELALICVSTGRLERAQLHLGQCREILMVGQNWRGLAGHNARAEGVVAAAEGRFEAANRQFAKAVKIHHRYQVPFEEAETLHYWGRALLAAGNTGAAQEKLDTAIELYLYNGAGAPWLERVQADRLRAQSAVDEAEKLDAAAEIYRHCGAGLRWIERALAANLDGPGASVGKASEPAGVQFAFRKQGEYWTISFKGGIFRLKDVKGMRYIAHLLRHPGVKFSVIELAHLTGTKAADPVAVAQPRGSQGGADIATQMRTDLGDAGTVLDSKAKADYRQRLDELREELEDAAILNDLGRKERLREEFEFVTAELAAAIGLRGRDRKTASHVERARSMVSNRIRFSMSRIGAVDSALGRHLNESIRTGYQCAYLPKQLVDWQF